MKAEIVVEKAHQDCLPTAFYQRSLILVDSV